MRDGRWSARCCWPCRARTSSARSPAARRANAARGPSPRSGTAWTPARTCCASTTSRRRRTSWPCGPCCAASASWRPTRASAPSATLVDDRRRPLNPTRPGAGRPTHTNPGDPMSSVLDRSALEKSPLADLHLLANELGVDGFRRLRKPELVDAIVARQSDEPAAEEPVAEEPIAEEERPEPRG